MEMRILDQADVWIDRNGVEHRIEDMPGRYALNVYNFLKGKHREIGFHYGLYLGTISLPDIDTAAYDDVLSGIERAHRRIGEDSLAWILDKPLLRALLARVAVDRIERSATGYDYAADAQVKADPNFRPYQVEHDLEIRPEADFDREEFGQRPGDETRVFVVIESDYDSYNLLTCFVGNRLAAYEWEAEYNRYNDFASVHEMDDQNAGQPNNLYAQIRRYRTPWTEIELATSIDLETSEIVNEWQPVFRVRNDADPEFSDDKTTDGARGRYNARIVTRGPDTQWATLCLNHASRVNAIRVNILDDLTKDMP